MPARIEFVGSNAKTTFVGSVYDSNGYPHVFAWKQGDARVRTLATSPAGALDDKGDVVNGWLVVGHEVWVGFGRGGLVRVDGGDGQRTPFGQRAMAATACSRLSFATCDRPGTHR